MVELSTSIPLEKPLEDDGAVEMSFEEFLIYSARIGELDDVRLSIDDKVDPNTTDKSGTGALRKLISVIRFRYGMC
jgi:hypothetical protein